MIWEPFILALVLGIIVSAGLYFAYVWEEPALTDGATGEPPQAPWQDSNKAASETPSATGSPAPALVSADPASPAS